MITVMELIKLYDPKREGRVYVEIYESDTSRAQTVYTDSILLDKIADHPIKEIDVYRDILAIYLEDVHELGRIKDEDR